MAQTSFYIGGIGGVGDGSIPSTATVTTTNLYLEKYNSKGLINTSYRIWLTGNGETEYRVDNAYIQQGSILIAVKCNGKSSFSVPAFGRWSDAVSVSTLTLPGYVDFITVTYGNIPILNHLPDGENAPGIGSAVDDLTEDDIPVSIETSVPSTFGVITVTDNTSLSGSTITINGIVYTFVNSPTGANNEILIGLTEEQTAESIVNVLHGAQDALLSAAASSHNPNQILILNYNGLDGSTSWIEEAQNLLPYEKSGVLDTARKKFGSAALYSENGIEADSKYFLPYLLTGDITLHGWFYWHGSFASLTAAPNECMETPIIYIRNTQVGDYGAGFGLGIRADWVDDDHVADTFSIKLTQSLSIEQVDFGQSPYNIPYDTTNPIIEDHWNHIAFIIHGNNILYAINGLITNYVTYTGAMGGVDMIDIGGVGGLSPNIPGFNASFDGWELTSSAIWTENFIPPEYAPTIKNNNVFIVDVSPSGMDWTTDATGLELSTIRHSVAYTASRPAATLPIWSASGSGLAIGELGETFINVNIPKLSGGGTASSESNVAAATLPILTSNVFAYRSGISGSSTEADWISLLMYQDDWMEYAAGIIVSAGDSDEKALSSVQYVAEYIIYTSDTDDDWKYPRFTLLDGSGDCEDGAFLVASLLVNSGVDPSRVRVYIGTYLGVGHAWVEYRRESDNQWVTLDWTKGDAYWSAISDISELPKTYPDQMHLYTAATHYITTSDVAVLAGDDYTISLMISEAALTLPLLTGAASTANRGSAAVTLPLFTASGTRNNFGQAILTLPLFSADGTIGFLTADASLTIPKITIAATAHQTNLVSLAKSLPKLKMAGTGYQIKSGAINVELPALEISGTASERLKGIADLYLPALTGQAAASSERNFDDHILKHTYDTWGYGALELPPLTLSAGAS